MKVYALISKLQEMPPDADVLLMGRDHDYITANLATRTTALYDGGEWTEDYGEEYTSEADFGKRLQVVVIE